MSMHMHMHMHMHVCKDTFLSIDLSLSRWTTPILTPLTVRSVLIPAPRSQAQAGPMQSTAVSAAEAEAADGLQRLRYFQHFSDADGQVIAAGELERAAARLLYDDVLLKEGAPRQLILLLGNPRPDAQIAACRALVACCRFPSIQQEFVAENGVGPLVPLLGRSGVDPMVCVHACLATTAVAQHPEGQEAFTGAGALRKLMVLARDELHPAQDEAAAALAAVGGHKSAANSAAVTSVSSQEAAESFVLMVAHGGSISREQASLGIRQLCGTARSRQRLVDAGAVPALLGCSDFWKPEVAKAAALALAGLCEEPSAARAVPSAQVPPATEGQSKPRSGLDCLEVFVDSKDGATRLAGTNPNPNPNPNLNPNPQF